MTKEVIWTDQLMIPIAHFSHAVKVENVIHVGATAGTDAERRLAGATRGLVDVSAQIYKMFENLETVLGLLGAGLGDVARLKTYLADPRSTPLYHEIYAKCFRTVRPSHTVVASWGFPLPQAAVELDALGIIGAAAAIRARRRYSKSEGASTFPRPRTSASRLSRPRSSSLQAGQDSACARAPRLIASPSKISTISCR